MKVYVVRSKFDIIQGACAEDLVDLHCGTKFAFNTSRYDYLVLQVVVINEFSENLIIKTTPLKTDIGEIPDSVICFNTDYTDGKGNKYHKPFVVQAGVSKSLFFGFDLTHSPIGDVYTSIFLGNEELKLLLHVNDNLMFNDGSDNIYTGSRLKWFHSNIGAYINKPLTGYDMAISKDNKILLTGKEYSIGNDGLIEDVESYFTKSNTMVDEVQNHLFFRPMLLEIEGQKVKYTRKNITGRGAYVSYSAEGKSEKARVYVNARVFYEGTIKYDIKIVGEKEFITDNVSLNAYFNAHTFKAGFGKKMQSCSSEVYKFDNILDNNIFIGDINCGAMFCFEAQDEKPLYEGKNSKFVSSDFYASPWQNRGLGKAVLFDVPEGVVLRTESGRIIIPEGRSETFSFTIHLTPFKSYNIDRAFRELSIANAPSDADESYFKNANKLGVNTTTISYPMDCYSEPNFPFDKFGALKKHISEYQKCGIKTSIVFSHAYTSATNPDVRLMKLFGNEYFVRSYLAGKEGFVETSGSKIKEDQKSYLLKVGSGSDNYYAEAVNYLIHNSGVGGVIGDGYSMTPVLAERVKRILDEGGAPLGFKLMPSEASKDDNGECKNYVYKHIPILGFVDSVIIPNNVTLTNPMEFLIENTAIPFGTNGEIQAKADPMFALLFGMRVGIGYAGESEEATQHSLNNYLARIGMQGRRYYGFWDDANPVSTDEKGVFVSSFINEDSMVIAVYNSNPESIKFDLGINPKLGFTSVKKKILRPLIMGVQTEKIINFNKQFKLSGNKGMLLYVK